MLGALRRGPSGQAGSSRRCGSQSTTSSASSRRHYRRRFELLRPRGRIAVISFHSLEDRIVKRFFRAEARGCVCPPDFPVCACGRDPVLRVLTTRAVPPGRPRDCAQPALGIRAAARCGEGLMAATAPVARTRPPRPRLAKARAKAAPRTAQRRLAGGIVWIVIVAAMLAGRGGPQRRRAARQPRLRRARPEAREAAGGERCPRLAARERRVDRPHSDGRCRGAWRNARLPGPDHIRRAAPVMRAPEAVRPPHSPAAPRAADGLRDVARPRDVAADRAGGRPQPARVEPTARDRDHPGRSGDDRRPDGRPARDRARRRSPST